MEASERIWPGVSAELRYKPMRMSGEFREIICNRNFSNEEIGRIVRCIAMETDFFLTPRIEAEVYHYRKVMERKRVSSERVRKYRKVKRGTAGSADGGTVSNDVVVCNSDGSVLGPGVANGGDTIFCSEKTPTNPIEKRPPIAPLEKTSPSSLENHHRRGRLKSDKEKLMDGLQQNLFAFVSGGGSTGKIQSPPKSAREGTSEREEHAPIQVDVQDIERDSSALLVANDTRADFAWIPERFAVFWNRYPKRVGKASAQKAFTKLIKGQHDVEKFMKTTLASIEWWKRQSSWKKDDGKYIPYPATWLNRGCWEDINENQGKGSSGATYLDDSQDSEEELIRRMRGD